MTSMVRVGNPAARWRSTVSGNSVSTVARSLMWIVWRSRTARPPTLLGLAAKVPPIDKAPGKGPCAATNRRDSPSRRKIETSLAPQSRAALSATTSITGWRSVGELEMTRRISAVAVCCSRASVSSRFRASSSVNSRTFSIAITAWSAKVFSELDLLVREGLDLTPPHVDGADGTPSRSSGVASIVRAAGTDSAASASTVTGNSVSGSARHVLDVDACADQGPLAQSRAPRSTANAAPVRLVRRAMAHVCATRWRTSPSRRKIVAFVRAAESRGALGHDVHHRLEVGRRAGDHPQDLRGRRLLLERLGQLAVPGLELREQPHVLDGDHRLVGEGLQERDLRSSENGSTSHSARW